MVLPEGIEPSSSDFQSAAMTTFAKVAVLGWPGDSNPLLLIHSQRHYPYAKTTFKYPAPEVLQVFPISLGSYVRHDCLLVPVLRVAI